MGIYATSYFAIYRGSNIGHIMGLRCTLANATLVLTVTAFCLAQERFEKGDLKGFTKSPTEHIIDVPEYPFWVRSVKGVVLDLNGARMGGVVVEIRDEAGRIRGTKTNSNGMFTLSGVPEGRYKFKVTMNGFQSVVGDVVVTEKASPAGQMKITMRVGV